MSGRGWLSAWLPVVGWILLIFSLSSIPNLSPPRVGLPQVDKICHLGEYGVLGFLMSRAAWPRARLWRAALLGALLGITLGAIDENYQRLTPGRDTSALDATADMAGASLGSVAWSGLALWLGRRRSGRVP